MPLAPKRKSGRELQRVAGCHLKYLEKKRSLFLKGMEQKQKLRIEAPGSTEYYPESDAFGPQDHGGGKRLARGQCRNQAIYKGIEGEEWENMYHKLVETHKAVNVRHPSGEQQGQDLWKVRDAKERGDAYYDETSEQGSTGIVVTHTCSIQLWRSSERRGEWRCGTTLAHRRQAGAQPEPLLLSRQRMDFVEFFLSVR